MTSKLPVVGKRYRQRETHQEVKVLNNFVRLRCAVDNFLYEEEGDYFNEFYEELPDSNPQEVEEDCPFETAAEEWNTTEVKEVSEVERALEAEKKPFFKVREEGHFEGSPPSAETLAKYGMSKPEPKIDMKEERVEPVSIWDKSPAFKIETESEYLHRLILGMQKDIEELKRKG